MKYQEALEKVVAAIPEVDLIDFTREVTRIPSIHGNELAVGKVFATRMSELGMDVREMDVEQDRFNIVGTVRGTGGGRSLMLNGHLDTVGPMLGWTKDPYGAVLEDGKIYGQGISNMKASDTAMVYAAHAIKRAGIALKGDLVVALVVGECAGGIGTKTLMQSGVKTDAFLCTEPTDLGILTVHASSQYFRVNIIGRSGHFAMEDLGVNAIMKIYELTQRLGPMHQPLPAGGWIRFSDKPQYHGLPRYQLGTIRGGMTREFHESPNLTPDFCTAVLNVRATPDRPVASTQQDIEGVLAAMQREDPEFAYEVMAVRALPGFEAPEGSYLVDAVTRAYTDVCGRSPDVGPIPPFVLMGSDSGQMQSAGMAHGALIGPGKFSSSLADEYVEVDKIVAATKIYAATALRVCGYVE
jgi:acetylornithine deacetylase